MVTLQPPLFELARRQISKRLVRTLLVVVSPVCLGEYAGFGDAVEQGFRQELVSEPTMEALSESILPGMTRLDVGGPRLLSAEPQPQPLRDQLRAVIHAQELRRTIHREDPLKNRDHPAGRDRGRHLDPQRSE